MPPPVPPYGSADPGSDEQSSDVLPPFNAVVPPKARVAMRAGEAQTRSLQLRDGRQIQVLVAGPESGVRWSFITAPLRRGRPAGGDRCHRPEGGADGARLAPGLRRFDGAARSDRRRRGSRHHRDPRPAGPLALLCGWMVRWRPPRAGLCRARARSLPGGCDHRWVAPYEAAGLDWLAGMGPENVEEFSYALEGGAPFDEFLTQSASAARDVTGSQIADELGGLLSAADRNALSEEMAEFWPPPCGRLFLRASRVARGRSGLRARMGL